MAEQFQLAGYINAMNCGVNGDLFNPHRVRLADTPGNDTFGNSSTASENVWLARYHFSVANLSFSFSYFHRIVICVGSSYHGRVTTRLGVAMLPQ